MRRIESVAFDVLKSEIEAYRRPDGYYLIDLIDISDLRREISDEEMIREIVFQHYDEDEWLPKDQRPPVDGTWADYAVDRDSARIHVVEEALIGGPGKGYLSLTIPRETAQNFFERFASFFETPQSYYIRMGLGSQSHVFGDGVVIISQSLAGILWVLESD